MEANTKCHRASPLPIRGHTKKCDEAGQVVNRPDAQRAPHVEIFGDGRPMRLLVDLKDQDAGDYIPANGKEQIDACNAPVIMPTQTKQATSGSARQA